MAVEIAFSSINYKVEKQGGEQYPVIHVYGRTADNVLEHVEISGVDPYFYLDKSSYDPDDVADRFEEVVRFEDQSDDGWEYESIRGNPMSKIITEIPKQVGQIRDEFDITYEADVLFPNRFLVDNDIGSGLRVPERRDKQGSDTLTCDISEVEPVDVNADFRVHTMDIEVDDRFGFPQDGEQEIVCITSHDSYNDKYDLWLYAPDGVDPDATVDNYEFMYGEEKDVEIHAYRTEDAMLEAYVDSIQDDDPDIVCGWNSNDFDWPYLIDRMKALSPDSDRKLGYNRLSRINQVWRNKNRRGGPNIKGRAVFDLLTGYKGQQFNEKESYRLDYIGELELDQKKERYPGDIGDLWSEDTERLLEYNLRDVELCVQLNQQESIVDFWDEVSSFVSGRIEDVTTASDAVDQYVLKKAHNRFVLPSAGTQEYEDYEGGAVFDPITGLKDMVTVLDLASLYPMSMVTINASPETKIDDPENFDGDTFVSPNGIHFRKDQNGMVREIVDELLVERQKKKDLRDENDPKSDAFDKFDRQQASIKVVMNSLYGVLGWERFRLYDKSMGAAVTATGREVIKFTEKVVNELGFDVTYGDTDSVMIDLGADTSKEEAMKQGFEFEEEINARYGDFAKEQLNADEHNFDIEFEKLYKRFFQAGKKKRYAGHIIWKEGKDVDDIDITGFEFKRSDVSQITTWLQKKVIEMILRGSSKSEIRKFVTEHVQRVKKGEVSLDEIGIPGGIGKKLDSYDNPTAQVRGSLYANEVLGLNIRSGSKPKRVYLSRVNASLWNRLERNEERRRERHNSKYYMEFKQDPDVLCYEYADQVPKECEVNYDLMCEKTLEGPIGRVIEAIGIDWSEVEYGSQQTGLGDYW